MDGKDFLKNRRIDENVRIKDENSLEMDDLKISSYSEEEETSQLNYDVKVTYDKNICNSQKSEVKMESDIDSMSDDEELEKQVSHKSIQSAQTKTTKLVGTKRKTFTCPICEHISKNRKDHYAHTITHRISTNPNTYKCSFCDHTSTRIWNMGPHLLTHKDSSEIAWLHCKLCDFKTKFAGSFKLHMDRHSSKKMLKCEKCPYETISKFRLKHHKETHDVSVERKQYKCTYCSNIYLTDDTLKQHLVTHSAPTEVSALRCDQCDFTTNYKYKLRRHQKTHLSTQEAEKSSDQPQENGKMRSTLENEALSSKTIDLNTQITGDSKIESECNNALKLQKECENILDVDCIKRSLRLSPTHQNQNDNIETNTIETIENKLKNLTQFQTHMLTHEKTDTFRKCPVCDSKYDNLSDYKKHILTHRVSTNPDTYKCISCDYEVTRLQDMISHSIIHKTTSDINWHMCNICNFKSEYSSSIKQHMALHFPEVRKNYKCSECSYKTSKPGRLKRHEKRHEKPSERKRFECVYCPKSFSIYASLKEHLMKHSYQKVLLRCDQCDYSTTHTGAYRKHLNRHMDTSEVQVGHDLCSSSKSNLKLHSRKSVKNVIIPESSSGVVCVEASENIDQPEEVDKMELVNESEASPCKVEELDIEIEDTVKIEPQYDWESDDQSEKVSDIDIVKNGGSSLPSTHQSQPDGVETNISKSIQATDNLKVCQDCGDNNTKQCCMCNYTAQCKCDFKNHMYTHKNITNPPDMYKCTLCSRSFKYSKEFKTHMSEHKKALGPIKCPMCDLQCETYIDYKSHISIHKVASNPDTYQCGFCEYKASRMWNMKCHVLSHKSIPEVNLHKCHICKFKSRHKCSVKKHIARHFDQDGSLKCSECSYKTTESFALKQHKLMHVKQSDRKPLVNIRDDLMRHKDPVMIMSPCDSNSTNEDCCSDHMETHIDTVNDLLGCDSCDYKTSSESELRLHTRICVKEVIISESNDQFQEDDKMELVMENEIHCKEEEPDIEIEDIVKIEPQYDNYLEVEDQRVNLLDVDCTSIKREDVG